METVIRVRKLKPDLSVDGSVKEMTISGPDSGGQGVELATEMSGLVDPVSEAYTRSPGGRPGTNLVSTRFAERNVVFRVTILGDSDQWFKNEREWRRLWEYDGYTEIDVQTVNARRVLRVRLESYEVDTEYDPAVMGATDVVMSVVADDPFWYNFTELRSSGDKIAPGASKTYSLGNEAHSAVYPRFRIPTKDTASPEASVKLSYDGRVSTLPTPTLLGKAMYEMNTDPGSRQWTSAKDPNVWGRMNGIRYDVTNTERASKLVITSSLDRPVEAFVTVPYLRPW